MWILTGLFYSLVGGTILGVGMYQWDRWQERRQARALEEVNSTKES